jgi:hypothetical protein
MFILCSLEEKVPEAPMIENFQSFLTLRSRSSWEACDSGILIWRNAIAYILLFMGIPFLCVVILLASWNTYLQYFGMIIIWWLKPFFDRLILHVISIRFFRSDADYKTIRKGLIKTICRGLIGDLTWRRFSIYRSARMPIRILEGNKGKIITRRMRNLKNGGLDFSALLTMLMMLLELTLFFVCAAFLYLFFFEYAHFTFDLISDYSSQVSLCLLILSSITILINEPLYMCMGFGIYINSRSIVEGWDIELKFNSFVKTKNLRNHKKINVIPIVLSVLLLSSIVQPLQAEEWYQTNSDEVPVEVLDEVLASEDFGNSHTKKWIRFKDLNFDESSSGFNFDEMSLKEIIGFILRIFLIIAITAALIFFGYRIFKTKKKFSLNTSVPWKKTIVPGFAKQKSSENLIDDAKKYFDEGQMRNAWAACLSSVIELYAQEGNIVFALNDTESDCLVKINQSSLWGKIQSAQLIMNWITFAYAGIEPESKQFHEAILFCNELKNKLSISGDANE